MPAVGWLAHNLSEEYTFIVLAKIFTAIVELLLLATAVLRQCMPEFLPERTLGLCLRVLVHAIANCKRQVSEEVHGIANCKWLVSEKGPKRSHSHPEVLQLTCVVSRTLNVLCGKDDIESTDRLSVFSSVIICARSTRAAHMMSVNVLGLSTGIDAWAHVS